MSEVSRRYVVHFGNLPVDMTAEELAQISGVCGPVLKTKIPRPNLKGKQEFAFGFVVYGKQEEADACIKKFDNAVIRGRTVQCEMSQNDIDAIENRTQRGTRRRDRSPSPPRRERREEKTPDRDRSPIPYPPMGSMPPPGYMTYSPYSPYPYPPKGGYSQADSAFNLLEDQFNRLMDIYKDPKIFYEKIQEKLNPREFKDYRHHIDILMARREALTGRSGYY